MFIFCLIFYIYLLNKITFDNYNILISPYNFYKIIRKKIFAQNLYYPLSIIIKMKKNNFLSTSP